MIRGPHPGENCRDLDGREAGDRPPVGDPETGEIRLLEQRCGHCILNPAVTALPLAPGRVQQFVDGVRAANGHVICHSTYPPIAPFGTAAAMCRGYVDAYGLPKPAQELIDLGLGHIVEVPDPTKTTSERKQHAPHHRKELTMDDQQSTTPWRCEVAWHAHTDDRRGPTCHPDSARHPGLPEKALPTERDTAAPDTLPSDSE